MVLQLVATILFTILITSINSQAIASEEELPQKGLTGPQIEELEKQLAKHEDVWDENEAKCYMLSTFPFDSHRPFLSLALGIRHINLLTEHSIIKTTQR